MILSCYLCELVCSVLYGLALTASALQATSELLNLRRVTISALGARTPQDWWEHENPTGQVWSLAHTLIMCIRLRCAGSQTT